MYLVGLHIYYKMIHGPYNVKLNIGVNIYIIQGVRVSACGIQDSSEYREKLENLAVVLGWLWDVPCNYNKNRDSYVSKGTLAAYFADNVYQSEL